MQRDNRSRTIIGVLGLYASMITKFGSDASLLHPVEHESKPKRKNINPAKPSRFARPFYAIKRGYHYGIHGELRRNTPKRDKSISARQWRIRRNRLRQAIQATR